MTEDQAWDRAFGSPPEVIKNFKALQTSQTVRAIKAIVTEILISLVISSWIWIIPEAGHIPVDLSHSAAKTGVGRKLIVNRRQEIVSKAMDDFAIS